MQTNEQKHAAAAPEEHVASDMIGMARTGCELCNGLGRTAGGDVCRCVHRNVFREVISKFKYSAAGHHLAPPVRIDHFISGGSRSGSSRMANEEFIADVTLTAKRTLAEDDYKLFRYRHILGASASLIASRHAIPVESIVQRLDAIEATLGDTFRTMRPYALWPVGQYFSTRISGGARPCPVPAVRIQENGAPVRPPMR